MAHVLQGPQIKGPPGPHKNEHVLKTMNQNSVELRPVLLLPKANFSSRQPCAGQLETILLLL